MKIGGSTAWRIITQPISDRSLSDALIALWHGNPCPQVPQRHPRAIPAPSQCHPSAIPAPSPHHPRTIPAWQIGLLPNLGRFGAFFMDIEVLIGCSSRSSARRPCPEVSQRHPRVAKGLSIGSSARRPLPQPSQWHPRVARPSPNRSQNGFFPVS